MLEWELIAENTMRLKVFQGWLVGITGSERVVFIHDSDHRWKIEESKDGHQ